MNGTDQLGVGALWCWQSNQLTVEASLAPGVALLEDAAAVVLEIHPTTAPAGEVPMAAQTLPVNGGAPFTFDFNTEEMSFPVGPHNNYFNLFVTARSASGLELQTLHAQRIEVKNASYSGVEPEPPDVVMWQPIDEDLSAIAALEGENVIYYRKSEGDWPPVIMGDNMTFVDGVLESSGGGGGGAMAFFYKADANATAPNDPGPGYIRWNAATQVDATYLYFDWLTTDDFDAHLFFQLAKVGSRFVLQDQDLANHYQMWDIAGPVEQYPDWFAVPVVSAGGSGTPQFTHNTRLALLVATGSAGGGGVTVMTWEELVDAIADEEPYIQFGADITTEGNLTVPRDITVSAFPYRLVQGGAHIVLWYGPVPMLRMQVFQGFTKGQVCGTFCNGVVYPEWWGLVGTTDADGEHDLAINCAIHTGVGQECAVIVSLGAFRYVIKRPVDLRGSKCRLLGTGPSSTFLVASTNWAPDTWEWSGVFTRVLPPQDNTLMSAASGGAGLTDFTLLYTGTHTEVIPDFSSLTIAGSSVGAYNGTHLVKAIISPTVIRCQVAFAGSPTPSVATVQIVSRDSVMATGPGSCQSLVWIGAKSNVGSSPTFYTGVQGMYIAGISAVRAAASVNKRIHLIAWSSGIEENTILKDLNMNGFTGFGIGGEEAGGDGSLVINGLLVESVHMTGGCRRSALPVYVTHDIAGMCRFSEVTINMGLDRDESRLWAQAPAYPAPAYIKECPQFGFFVSGYHTVISNCHVESVTTPYYAYNNAESGCNVILIGCDHNNLVNLQMAYTWDYAKAMTGYPPTRAWQEANDARGFLLHHPCGVTCGEFPEGGTHRFTSGQLTVIGYKSFGTGQYVLRDMDYDVQFTAHGTWKYPNTTYSEVPFYSRGSYYGVPKRTAVSAVGPGTAGKSIVTVADTTGFTVGQYLKFTSDSPALLADYVTGTPGGFLIDAVGVGTITIVKTFTATMTGHAWLDGVPYDYTNPATDKVYFIGPIGLPTKFPYQPRATGTPDGTKFLRDDNSWQPVAGGGGTPGGASGDVQFNDGGVFGGDVGMAYNKATKALSVGGIVTATTRMEAKGSLTGTSMRMSYDAGATAYYNEIRNGFSGTATNHSMSFVLRQNSIEHTMMTFYADDRIVFNGASIFNGSVGVNLGGAVPQAALHIASGTITDGPMLALSYTDVNYRSMFRGTWSGSTVVGNSVRFTMRQAVDGVERTVWTAYGDGLMTVAANPTAPLGVATKQYVDAAVAGATAGVSSFNTRTGAVTLTSGDVTGALTYTPANVTHTHVPADILTVPTGTVFYRKTAAAGAAETQPLATLKTDLGLTGSNTGDQTITLTGDVTGSGTGSFAATIGNDKVTTAKILNGNVTLAKIENVSTGTLLYRRSAGSGPPESFSLATLKTDLGLTGTNSGDQTLSGLGGVPTTTTVSAGAGMTGGGALSGNITLNVIGSASIIVGADDVQRAALTGDVTAAQNSNDTTIGNDKVTTAKILNGNVTLSKIENVLSGTVLYRRTAGTGPVESILLSVMKSDMSLGSVDNTSDATKNAATATLTNKTHQLASPLGTNNTCEGTTIAGRNSGEAITQWDAVYLGSSSTWLKADADGTGTYPARGLALTTVGSAAALTVIVKGVVRNDAWAWTPGGTIYLSTTPGGLTQTAPATSGNKVQAVGWALSADEMYVDPNSEYLTNL